MIIITIIIIIIITIIIIRITSHQSLPSAVYQKPSPQQ